MSDPNVVDDSIPSVQDGPVLSTLNPDGSRRWLRPRPSPGRFLHRRRVVGYGLIALFTVMPWLRLNGKPPILIDLPAREFTFFGTTFLPTDTMLLALLMLIVILSIFLLTALVGRVWCGWACPQTVYMELLYRPIERLWEGRAYRDRRTALSTPRRIGKYATFLVISIVLAHTFLAYFVPTDELIQWMQRSPLEHPTGFLVVGAVTFLMMLDFAFLREQVCILMCPYGRLQSVLLDQQSLIVSYDETRGEPRGRKAKPGEDPDAARGDCVDCHLCVLTCPTGIDIRKGLQMECVNCTQCIDACDEVMERVGKPRGLIRYSSQAAMKSGQRRFLRPRVVVYPLILTAVVTAFIVALASRGEIDVWFQRSRNLSYSLNDTETEVTNQVLMRITNRTQEPRTYALEVLNGTFTSDDFPLSIDPAVTATAVIRATLPRSIFDEGVGTVEFRIMDDLERETLVTHRVSGPFMNQPAAPSAEKETNE